MKKFMAVHKPIKSSEEVTKVLNEGAPEFARAMAAGETKGRCLKTWSSFAHEGTDYMFCLWEADKAEDVEATLNQYGLLEYFTLESLEVDETDWVEMGEAVAV